MITVLVGGLGSSKCTGLLGLLRNGVALNQVSVPKNDLTCSESVVMLGDNLLW